MRNFIKRLKCKHVFHETNLEKYDPISGGYRLFRCSECLKDKYFYIPRINSMFMEQDIDIKFGKQRKFTLVRKGRM